MAAYDGLNLHAATAFEPHERLAVERYCRYALRGPLAASRLAQGTKDSLVYTLKLRGPLATSRLTQGRRGSLVYTLKQPKPMARRTSRSQPKRCCNAFHNSCRSRGCR